MMTTPKVGDWVLVPSRLDNRVPPTVSCQVIAIVVQHLVLLKEFGVWHIYWLEPIVDPFDEWVKEVRAAKG